MSVNRIIKHSFRIPPLEDLVRDADNNPFFTQISHGLQAVNQMTLAQLFFLSDLKLPKGGILDAGCGDGLLLALAPYTLFKRRGVGRRPIICVDKDPKKIEKAAEVAGLVSVDYVRRYGRDLNYLVQDSQDLALLDVDTMTIAGVIKDLPKIAMVWSNSVLHWMETKDKYSALARFYVMLEKEGVLCISMSAGGTARDFLRAYNAVMHRLGPFNITANQVGYRIADFKPDPIGSRPLDELRNMVEECGFEIITPITIGEHVSYQHPLNYAASVKEYGFDEFLKPVSHLPEEAKERLWEAILNEFVSQAKKAGWQEGKPYDYVQLNNYIIARKRPQLQELIAEESLLQSIFGERFLERSREIKRAGPLVRGGFNDQP